MDEEPPHGNATANSIIIIIIIIKSVALRHFRKWDVSEQKSILPLKAKTHF